MHRISVAVAALAVAFAVSGPARAESSQATLKDVHWGFDYPLGMYDQAQLQRGYKVYHEVCSACHAMSEVAFRNLADKGGPFWNPAFPNPNDNPVAKTLAKDAQYDTIDSETGSTVKRPGTTADYFPSPFPNEVAARAANNGALPPDMSLLAAAREGGAHYIYSIVTGDGTPPPPGLAVPDGKYYDPYMPGDLSSFWKGNPDKVPIGGFIAMPPPLIDDRVTFDDGTKATLNQEAWDVAAFLQWAADPKLDERKELGIEVMIFLLVFTALLYASYRSIWRNVGH